MRLISVHWSRDRTIRSRHSVSSCLLVKSSTITSSASVLRPVVVVASSSASSSGVSYFHSTKTSSTGTRSTTSPIHINSPRSSFIQTTPSSSSSFSTSTSTPYLPIFNTRTYPKTTATTTNMSTTTAQAADVFPPPSLRPILTEVTTLLKSRSETVAVAETAAGGLISAALLSTPGASKLFAGGLTLYTLESRIAYAGWTEENLKGYTGPTPAIVRGLAKHVRGDLDRATYVVAESGTAGPTGGETRNRRPGYVALAVDCEQGSFAREVETGLGGDREANMVRFAEEGLKLLRDVIKGEVKPEEKL